jgi:hypothetical protein
VVRAEGNVRRMANRRVAYVLAGGQCVHTRRRCGEHLPCPDRVCDVGDGEHRTVRLSSRCSAWGVALDRRGGDPQVWGPPSRKIGETKIAGHHRDDRDRTRQPPGPGSARLGLDDSVQHHSKSRFSIRGKLTCGLADLVEREYFPNSALALDRGLRGSSRFAGVDQGEKDSLILQRSFDPFDPFFDRTKTKKVPRVSRMKMLEAMQSGYADCRI